jgi:hypothetical protein
VKLLTPNIGETIVVQAGRTGKQGRRFGKQNRAPPLATPMFEFTTR